MKTCGFFGSSFLATSTVTTRLRRADLDGGKPDAGRVVHGLEHVLDQLADVRGDLLHRFGDQPQSLVGQNDDFAQRHGGRCKGSRKCGQSSALRVPAQLLAPSWPLIYCSLFVLMLRIDVGWRDDRRCLEPRGRGAIALARRWRRWCCSPWSCCVRCASATARRPNARWPRWRGCKPRPRSASRPCATCWPAAKPR